jgi:hypothetical protein
MGLKIQEDRAREKIRMEGSQNGLGTFSGKARLSAAHKSWQVGGLAHARPDASGAACVNLRIGGWWSTRRAVLFSIG